MPEQIEEIKVRKVRSPNKLSKNASRLLEILEGNPRLTKVEISRQIYGDDEHAGCVDNLIRRLRIHGHSIVLTPQNLGEFPPKPHLVQLVKHIKNAATVEAVNDRMQNDVRTRLSTNRMLFIAFVAEYPQMAGDIQREIETCLRLVLETKSSIDPAAYAHQLLNRERAALPNPS